MSDRGRIRLAEQVMEFVRDRLVLLMPLFNRALLVMPCEIQTDGELPPASSGAVFATDGERIFADADSLIGSFERDGEDASGLLHAYLHMIFHCLLSHPFHPEEMNRGIWDFACDLASEASVLLAEEASASGDSACIRLPEDDARRQVLDGIAAAAGGVSAERLYHWLSSGTEEAEEALQSASLFRMDDHELWLGGGLGGRIVYAPRSAAERMDEMRTRWLTLSGNVKVENLSRRQGFGDRAGRRSILLDEPDRDEFDYTEFLMRFAAPEEAVEINPEEFDYIYYTYGMGLYGNMPLIEPLEYRDTKKIRDFVIAIDTSGSCQGPRVRSFLAKTFSILKNAGVFAEPMNLRIFQCDCEIQQDVKITGDETLMRYMKELVITGGGGTDFRPVFRQTEEYIRSGEFRDLRGLIYFTDGYGSFPKEAPPFRTAFVFVGANTQIPPLPEWAEHYVLSDSWLDKAEHSVEV